MRRLGKLLYWKLTVPDCVTVLPVPQVRVASGPFRGMRYVHTAHASALSAKILGTYEKEIHACVRAAMAIPFEHIINIGAGEGYYAVGFARHATACREIIAFETDEGARCLIRQMAEWNHISNLSIRGQCGVSELNAVMPASGKTLVICDVEGFEIELLDPLRMKALARAWILVELHDFVRPGASELIYERFKPTHQIQKVSSVPRQWKDFPAHRSCAVLLPQTVAVRAMNEGRPGQMSWLWMQPIADLGE